MFHFETQLRDPEVSPSDTKHLAPGTRLEHRLLTSSGEHVGQVELVRVLVHLYEALQAAGAVDYLLYQSLLQFTGLTRYHLLRPLNLLLVGSRLLGQLLVRSFRLRR